MFKSIFQRMKNKCLIGIQLFLKLSQNAFTSYINDNRSYRAALVLYKTNKAFYTFLNAEIVQWATWEMSDVIMKLHAHLSGWLSQFEYESQSMIYEPQDSFNWERWPNVLPFPTEVYLLLEQYFDEA